MLDIYDEWNLGDSMCCQQLQFEIIWGPLQKQGVKREEGEKMQRPSEKDGTATKDELTEASGKMSCEHNLR